MILPFPTLRATTPIVTGFFPLDPLPIRPLCGERQLAFRRVRTAIPLTGHLLRASIQWNGPNEAFAAVRIRENLIWLTEKLNDLGFSHSNTARVDRAPFTSE